MDCNIGDKVRFKFSGYDFIFNGVVKKIKYGVFGYDNVAYYIQRDKPNSIYVVQAANIISRVSSTMDTE